MQSSMNAILVPVLTKTYDGGSNVTAKINVIHSRKEGYFDAFSYYSSQERRMNSLLGRDHANRTIPDNDDTSYRDAPISASSETRTTTNDNNSPPVLRQTRLSWEVHPSLIVK
jgi:hypothetical protein